jgi:hypothetical protein
VRKHIRQKGRQKCNATYARCAEAREATGDPCKGATGTTFALAFQRQPLLVAMQRKGTRRGNSSAKAHKATGEPSKGARAPGQPLLLAMLAQAQGEEKGEKVVPLSLGRNPATALESRKRREILKGYPVFVAKAVAAL